MSLSSNLKVIAEEKLVTTAGVRELLKDSRPNEVVVYTVTIKALSTNTGKIYIGDETVASTNGFPLDPRDSVTLNSEKANIDLSEIYIDSAVDGEGVRLIYMRE